MIRTVETVISKLTFSHSDGARSLMELTESAIAPLASCADRIGGVVAATFSNRERFPSLSAKVAEMLKLPTAVPAFDLNMACSAYPYALYLASKIAADSSMPVLVVDGDAQLRLVDRSDHATGSIFSDAVSATLVNVSEGGCSHWSFFTRANNALSCSESGPIRMDGMAVFSFVARDVQSMMREFINKSDPFDWFAPHQANAYMVRQLAKALGLEAKLVTIPEAMKNPGSASIPMAISMSGKTGRFLIAGFGAGYSAAIGTVRVVDDTEIEVNVI